MTTASSIRASALATCCFLLLTSGCATIAHGRHQRIQVATNPPAAKVSVEGTRRAKKATALQFETPGEVILSRKEKHVIVRIEKEGYEPAEIVLTRTLSAWTPIGAASFLGLGIFSGAVEGGVAFGLAAGAAYLGLSLGVDLVTGSAYLLEPATVFLTLQPRAGPAPNAHPPLP